MTVKKYARELALHDRMFRDIAEKRETVWINDRYGLPADVCTDEISPEAIDGAEARLERFAPFIKKVFPETAPDDGLIESPLREIGGMRDALAEEAGRELPGRLFLKMDSELAIAGSVKARGGIYEVLKHAEDLAASAGLISGNDNYECFASEKFRNFFGDYTIQVGSTGNLGLSIGIMSAAMGFKVKVHMSADARQWKKDLLRSKGAEVIEYADDYSKAVSEGRKASLADPSSYFVDDEYSPALFLGYTVAAKRLKKQLDEAEITVDADHPLFVYIPCGVGGAPGGICYGLKTVFGENAHVFFCEPVLYPSVLLGMATNRFENVSVRDFGLREVSAADWLACASPSGLVTRIDRTLVSGFFTVEDGRLFDYLRMLKQEEDIFIEPSSCAAFIGPQKFFSSSECKKYMKKNGIDADKLTASVHICWATGGKFVPEDVACEYLTN